MSHCAIAAFLPLVFVQMVPPVAGWPLCTAHTSRPLCFSGRYQHSCEERDHTAWLSADCCRVFRVCYQQVRPAGRCVRSTAATALPSSAFDACSILYQRGIYPPESFVSVTQYGLRMWVTGDDGLKHYLAQVLKQISGNHRTLYPTPHARLLCDDHTNCRLTVVLLLKFELRPSTATVGAITLLDWFCGGFLQNGCCAVRSKS